MSLDDLTRDGGRLPPRAAAAFMERLVEATAEADAQRRDLAATIAAQLDTWRVLHQRACDRCQRTRHGKGCKLYKEALRLAADLRSDAAGVGPERRR